MDPFAMDAPGGINSVMTSLMKPVLPLIFFAQFMYLYRYGRARPPSARFSVLFSVEAAVLFCMGLFPRCCAYCRPHKVTPPPLDKFSKARLLRDECGSKIKRHIFGKALDEILPTTACSGVTPLLAVQ